MLNKYNKVTLQRLDKGTFPADISITSVKIGAGIQEFTFHIRDLTQEVKVQTEMKRLAYCDGLTGLYNRVYFKTELIQKLSFAAQQQSSILLMFLDLDKFKYVNDTLGHKAGDKLLQQVAKHLLDVARSGDVVCRWGGDEFLIMFPTLESPELISAKAEEIIKKFKIPFDYEGQNLHAKTSIGIALSKHGDISPDELIQHADIAMYEAKKLGRNQYCFFNTEMEEKFNESYFYESELAYAIEQQQFKLFYQPKINCQTGAIVGFEALIRWLHPEKGLIPPTVFIPILEKSGQITKVSYWVLDTVCAQIKAWQDELQVEIPVAVNLSGKDFLDKDLYQTITHCLDSRQLTGNLLELEITETVLAENTEHCIELMKQLKEKHIKFSIDDFGTGYSSMSYLKKFPIDTLKIDRAFVRECHIDHEDAAICTAILTLGKSLGLKIVAEGIELEAQLEFLKKLGCDDYQGYLFSKPISTLETTRLLQKYKTVQQQ